MINHNLPNKYTIIDCSGLRRGRPQTARKCEPFRGPVGVERGPPRPPPRPAHFPCPPVEPPRRVRFADEIADAQAFPPPVPTRQKTYFYQLHSKDRPGVATKVTPQPPPYQVAFERLRQARRESTEDEQSPAEVRTSHHWDRGRSASLPRRLHSRDTEQWRDFHLNHSQMPPGPPRNYMNILAAARSLENLEMQALKEQEQKSKQPLLRMQVPYEVRAQFFDDKNAISKAKNHCVMPSSSFNEIINLSDSGSRRTKSKK